MRLLLACVLGLAVGLALVGTQGASVLAQGDDGGAIASPSSAPIETTTSRPTSPPTLQPTLQPTSPPTLQPTTQPLSQPTSRPTSQPTSQPTKPTRLPTSKRPSTSPTPRKTNSPISTGNPSARPSKSPTPKPSRPTRVPSRSPEVVATQSPAYFRLTDSGVLLCAGPVHDVFAGVSYTWDGATPPSDTNPAAPQNTALTSLESCASYCRTDSWFGGEFETGGTFAGFAPNQCVCFFATACSLAANIVNDPPPALSIYNIRPPIVTRVPSQSPTKRPRVTRSPTLPSSAPSLSPTPTNWTSTVPTSRPRTTKSPTLPTRTPSTSPTPFDFVTSSPTPKRNTKVPQPTDNSTNNVILVQANMTFARITSEGKLNISFSGPVAISAGVEYTEPAKPATLKRSAPFNVRTVPCAVLFLPPINATCTLTAGTYMDITADLRRTALTQTQLAKVSLIPHALLSADTSMYVAPVTLDSPPEDAAVPLPVLTVATSLDDNNYVTLTPDALTSIELRTACTSLRVNWASSAGNLFKPFTKVAWSISTLANGAPVPKLTDAFNAFTKSELTLGVGTIAYKNLVAGLFRVQITLTNVLGISTTQAFPLGIAFGQNITAQVNNVMVQVDGVSRSPDGSLVLDMNQLFVVRGIIEQLNFVNCDKPTQPAVLPAFAWSITGPASFVPSYRKSDVSITVRPGVVTVPGDYTFTLSTLGINTSLTATVIDANTPSIVGGNRFIAPTSQVRLAITNAPVVFSKSMAPALANVTASPWECYYTLGNDSDTALNCPDSFTANPVGLGLTVRGADLDSDYQYFFTVPQLRTPPVYVCTVPVKPNEFSVYIETPALGNYNYARKLALKAMTKEKVRVQYSWEMFQGDLTPDDLANVTLNSQYLIFPAFLLSPGFTYVFAVRATSIVTTTSPDSRSIMATVEFTTNSPPQFGAVYVSPMNGTAVKTDFTFVASLFSSTALPLSYAFYSSTGCGAGDFFPLVPLRASSTARIKLGGPESYVIGVVARDALGASNWPPVPMDTTPTEPCVVVNAAPPPRQVLALLAIFISPNASNPNENGEGSSTTALTNVLSALTSISPKDFTDAPTSEGGGGETGTQSNQTLLTNALINVVASIQQSSSNDNSGGGGENGGGGGGGDDNNGNHATDNGDINQLVLQGRITSQIITEFPDQVRSSPQLFNSSLTALNTILDHALAKPLSPVSSSLPPSFAPTVDGGDDDDGEVPGSSASFDEDAEQVRQLSQLAMQSVSGLLDAFSGNAQRSQQQQSPNGNNQTAPATPTPSPSVGGKNNSISEDDFETGARLASLVVIKIAAIQLAHVVPGSETVFFTTKNVVSSHFSQTVNDLFASNSLMLSPSRNASETGRVTVPQSFFPANQFFSSDTIFSSVVFFKVNPFQKFPKTAAQPLQVGVTSVEFFDGLQRKITLRQNASGSDDASFLQSGGGSELQEGVGDGNAGGGDFLTVLIPQAPPLYVRNKSIPENSTDMRTVCGAYDYAAGNWSQQGCTFVGFSSESGGDAAVCRCNHTSDYSAWIATGQDLQSAFTNTTVFSNPANGWAVILLLLLWAVASALCFYVATVVDDRMMKRRVRAILLSLKLKRLRGHVLQKRLFRRWRKDADLYFSGGNAKHDMPMLPPALSTVVDMDSGIMSSSSPLRPEDEGPPQAMWKRMWESFKRGLIREHTLLSTIFILDAFLTRPMRVLVGSAAVLGEMFASAMFYNFSIDPTVTVGTQLLVAFLSAVVVWPAVVVFVFLVRRVNPYPGARQEYLQQMILIVLAELGNKNSAVQDVGKWAQFAKNFTWEQVEAVHRFQVLKEKHQELVKQRNASPFLRRSASRALMFGRMASSRSPYASPPPPNFAPETSALEQEILQVELDMAYARHIIMTGWDEEAANQRNNDSSNNGGSESEQGAGGDALPDVEQGGGTTSTALVDPASSSLRRGSPLHPGSSKVGDISLPVSRGTKLWLEKVSSSPAHGSQQHPQQPGASASSSMAMSFFRTPPQPSKASSMASATAAATAAAAAAATGSDERKRTSVNFASAQTPSAFRLRSPRGASGSGSAKRKTTTTANKSSSSTSSASSPPPSAVSKSLSSCKRVSKNAVLRCVKCFRQRPVPANTLAAPATDFRLSYRFTYVALAVMFAYYVIAFYFTLWWGFKQGNEDVGAWVPTVILSILIDLLLLQPVILFIRFALLNECATGLDENELIPLPRGIMTPRTPGTAATTLRRTGTAASATSSAANLGGATMARYPSAHHHHHHQTSATNLGQQQQQPALARYPSRQQSRQPLLQKTLSRQNDGQEVDIGAGDDDDEIQVGPGGSTATPPSPRVQFNKAAFDLSESPARLVASGSPSRLGGLIGLGKRSSSAAVERSEEEPGERNEEEEEIHVAGVSTSAPSPPRDGAPPPRPNVPPPPRPPPSGKKNDLQDVDDTDLALI